MKSVAKKVKILHALKNCLVQLKMRCTTFVSDSYLATKMNDQMFMRLFVAYIITPLPPLALHPNFLKMVTLAFFIQM